MKVLHISSGNLYGGVEVLLATLAREQACCPEMEPYFALCFEGRLSHELIELGVPAQMLGSVQTRFPWQVWMARRRLAALLRKESFDVVVCHMAWAHAIFGPVVRRAGLPLVFWMHDAAQGRHWIERWAARCPPDLVVSNSQYTANTLPNLFSGRTAPACEIIHCPVSLPVAPLAPAERAALRSSLDTPQDACVIIQVSRMEPYKGHALHLDALARLADVPGWICWIVGAAQRPHEQAYLAQLREQAAKAGIGDRVRFTGDRRDVRAVLSAADVFCQPNLGPEPFGIVFIEALYARLPVLSTARGGALEIVDETCGRLVAPDSAESVAAVLRQLLTDGALRQKLGDAGADRAAQLCAPAGVLARLQTALTALLPPLASNEQKHVPDSGGLTGDLSRSAQKSKSLKLPA